MTEHVMFAAAIKAERLRLLAQIERDRLLLETVDKIDALYRHFDDIAPAAEDDRTEFERVTNPESDAPAPLPASVIQAAEPTDTVQRSAPAKQSAEEPLSNGSGEVQDECAIHLPNNSNNAPAEDARLEDGLSPSKEGGTTSAATDDSAGTSVSSADPDGGGSNSPETANQSAAARKDVPQTTTDAEVTTPEANTRGQTGTIEDHGLAADPPANMEAVAKKVGQSEQEAVVELRQAGTQAPPADTNPEQEIGGAEGDVRPETSSSDTSGIPTPALGLQTGKPAGETDGSPAAPVSMKERVAQTYAEHPDWMIGQFAAHLGITASAAAGHLSRLNIKLGHKGSPRRRGPDWIPLKDRVLACHRQHPDWSQKQVADELKVGTGSVSNAVKGLGIIFPVSPNSLPKADSQRARMEAYMAEHPEATSRQVADALDLSPNRVRAISIEAGIQLRKLTPEEMRAARRAGALKSAAVRRGDSSLPVDDGAESRRRKYGEPEGASDIELAPQPFTAGDQDEEPVHPTVAKFGSPNAKWFRLRRSDGMWLHMSGHGFTVEKKDGWIGKIGQLRAIRGNPRYPDARGLQIIGVTQVAK